MACVLLLFQVVVFPLCSLTRKPHLFWVHGAWEIRKSPINSWISPIKNGQLIGKDGKSLYKWRFRSLGTSTALRLQNESPSQTERHISEIHHTVIQKRQKWHSLRLLDFHYPLFKRYFYPHPAGYTAVPSHVRMSVLRPWKWTSGAVPLVPPPVGTQRRSNGWSLGVVKRPANLRWGWDTIVCNKINNK